jgi:NAD(P)-dependent dehydrogenase (short-subunit alcohol dehydrogenase family)
MAFNNAGIQAPPSDAADEPAEVFDRVNAINLRGVWACMKHELGQMRARAAARSSTAHPSAVSSDSRAGPPIMPPNTG